MNLRPLLLTLLFPLVALAQTVDINKINGDSDSDTTIQIHKGKPGEPPLVAAKWEVQDGMSDVDGEASATGRDAKKAWQKACTDWKKEFREDNKDNKILHVNCGSVNCSGEAGSKVCSSKATYKIKTRVD